MRDDQRPTEQKAAELKEHRSKIGSEREANRITADTDREPGSVDERTREEKPR